MSNHNDATLELQKLQSEVMQQLEIIADDITAGRLGADEGAARARALIATSEQQRVAMFNAAISASQRQRRRGWLFASMVVIAIAMVVVGLLLARIGTA
ncbi:hypothetical protein [Stenotrophomonas sp.]|uniref:hypothetical protein n=1 Tax=Stenotrophomonas sp. TaxID=69392 RepID=UPI0028B00D5E|nr:hypothetical protein [Stenotrophomonas sp.]